VRGVGTARRGGQGKHPHVVLERGAVLAVIGHRHAGRVPRAHARHQIGDLVLVRGRALEAAQAAPLYLVGAVAAELHPR